MEDPTLKDQFKDEDGNLDRAQLQDDLDAVINSDAEDMDMVGGIFSEVARRYETSE